MERQHPLIEAIRLRNRAKRQRVHPKIMERLENRIIYESKKSLNIMSKSSVISKIIKGEDIDLKDLGLKEF